MSKTMNFLEREVMDARFDEVLAKYYEKLEKYHIKIDNLDNHFVQEYYFLARIKNELWTTCDPTYLTQAELILSNAENYMATMD